MPICRPYIHVFRGSRPKICPILRVVPLLCYYLICIEPDGAEFPSRERGAGRDGPRRQPRERRQKERYIHHCAVLHLLLYIYVVLRL